MRSHLRSAVIIVVAAVLAISLGGCSLLNPTSGVSEARTRTLVEAKNSFLQTEDQLLALVPKEDVARTLSKTTKATMLFSCTEHDTYSWPGHYTVVLASGVDGVRTVTQVSDAWSRQPGWSASPPSVDGTYTSVRFTHADGRNLKLSFDSRDRSLAAVGTSACFYLATYPLNEY